jgi:hypothetical protein
MSLVHGEEIGSRELEATVGGPAWDADRFARLCNAIIWTEAGHERSSSFSLTERVFVRDKGIDAELEIEVSPSEFDRSRFLIGGWNVLQYKKREGGNDRANAISGIRNTERSAIKKIFEKTSRRPNSYVLLVNLDLDHEDKRLLRESILDGYDRRDGVKVEVFGAGELAAALNNLPHLRSAFFATADFQTWQRAWNAHLMQKSVAHAALIGRDTEATGLRTLVDDPTVRVIFVSGPSGIGKSRLILEATKHRSLETVHALDPQSLSVRDLLALESPKKETIVLVEEPESTNLRELLTQTLTRPELKLLVTAHRVPATAQDTRIGTVPLMPLDDEASRTLLRATAQIDFSLESWILAQAGGNPELLLRAAAAGQELRSQALGLVASLAEVFEERIRSEFGEEILTLLRLLSLLTYVGVKSPHAEELPLVCTRLGGDIDLNRALLGIDQLVKMGFLRLWGPYVEVVPPFLANHLAKAALKGRLDAVVSLLAELPLLAQSRMLRRLSQTGGEEAREFQETLFKIIFKDLNSVLDGTEVIYPIVESIPEKVAAFVTDEIQKLDEAELQALSVERRRVLRHVIERLWLRRSTCRDAIAILIRLAGVRREEKPRPLYGDDLTPLLVESFHPQHPQVPLTCPEKFEILQNLVRNDVARDLRLIGIRTISSALETQSVMLRESSGAEPLDARPRQTYGDVWTYNERLIDLLVNLADDKDSEVASAAVHALPRALYQGFIQGASETAVDEYGKIVSRALKDPSSISIARLRDSIERAVRALSSWQEESSRPEFERWAKTLEGLMKSMQSSSNFEVRVRNVAGGWTYSEEDDSGRFDALAAEALSDTKLLRSELLDWLCSPEAERGHSFFWALGRIDNKHVWLDRIKWRISMPRGASAFISYLGGLAQNESEFVDQILDALLKDEEVAGSVILHASLYSRDASGAVRRITTLLGTKRIDPTVTAGFIASPWLKQINPDELQTLLKAIAGPDFEFAVEAVLVLDAAVFAKQPLSDEVTLFAWKCLQAARNLEMNDYFHCDHLAANLAQQNPQAAFSEFHELIRRPWSERSWNPISAYSGQSQLWGVLTKLNREKTVLDLLSADAETKFAYSFANGAREFIDPAADRALLLRFAESGEKQALVIARILSASNSGFWDLAFEILERFPTSEEIREALSHGAQRMGEVSVGFSGPGIALSEIESKLRGQLTPTARAWLEELASRLRQRVKEMAALELERKINR